MDIMTSKGYGMQSDASKKAGSLPRGEIGLLIDGKVFGIKFLTLFEADEAAKALRVAGRKVAILNLMTGEVI
jgi:hypothetical protein